MAIQGKKKKTIRLSVTISVELHDMLKELSEHSGKSMAHWPALFLEEAKPSIEAMNKALVMAKKDKDEAFQMLNEHADRSMIKLARKLYHD